MRKYKPDCCGGIADALELLGCMNTYEIWWAAALEPLIKDGYEIVWMGCCITKKTKTKIGLRFFLQCHTTGCCMNGLKF